MFNFVDSKKYTDRIVASQEKTGLKDAIRAGYGPLNGQKLVMKILIARKQLIQNLMTVLKLSRFIQ